MTQRAEKMAYMYIPGWGLAKNMARNGIYTPETACLFLAESSANISHRFLQRAQRAQRLAARLTAFMSSAERGGLT
jgi:hypothetical protein